MVRLPAAANFRLYFLCWLALMSDEGGIPEARGSSE